RSHSALYRRYSSSSPAPTSAYTLSLHDALPIFGGIDILVNNAADTAVGDFASFSRDDIDRSVRGVLQGPLYCTRAVLDYMLPKRDRKSTRLNSSHRTISYAVFCLKKTKRRTRYR